MPIVNRDITINPTGSRRPALGLDEYLPDFVLLFGEEVVAELESDQHGDGVDGVEEEQVGRVVEYHQTQEEVQDTQNEQTQSEVLLFLIDDIVDYSIGKLVRVKVFVLSYLIVTYHCPYFLSRKKKLQKENKVENKIMIPTLEYILAGESQMYGKT